MPPFLWHGVLCDDSKECLRRRLLRKLTGTITLRVLLLILEVYWYRVESRTKWSCAGAFGFIFKWSKMADEQSGVQRSISKIKQWIGWSWTYLWGFWFLLVIFLLYVLRTPLRLKENLNLGKSSIIICLWGINQENSRRFTILLKK